MSSLDHNRWDDDLAAYALGALDGRERSEFETHLAGCNRCQIELRWLEPALDALPASVEQLAPPPGLRKRILAAVDEDVPDLGRARSERAKRRSWLSVGAVRPALAAAATVVAVAVGLAGGYALRGDDDPDLITQTIPVQAASPAIQTTAAVVQHGDSWTLDVSDLPQPRDGDVYQVWIAHDGKVTPSVLFVPSHDDRADVALPRTIASADQIMVTREPSGGSLEPTSAPLLQSEL